MLCNVNFFKQGIFCNKQNQECKLLLGCNDYLNARGGLKVMVISVRLLGQHSPFAGLNEKACNFASILKKLHPIHDGLSL